MISNAFLESHLLTHAPLLIPSITTCPTFNKHINRNFNTLTNKRIALKPFDRTYPSYLITNNIPLNLKIYEIGIRYVCSNLNRNSAIIRWLTLHKPESLPTPTVNNIFKSWPKLKTTELSKQQLSSGNFTLPNSNCHLILRPGIKTGFQKLNSHARLIIGCYNFLTKDIQCICGKYKSPDNLHFLFHCSHFNRRRDYLLKISNSYKIPLRDFILKKPDIAHKFLKDILDTIDLIKSKDYLETLNQ